MKRAYSKFAPLVDVIGLCFGFQRDTMDNVKEHVTMLVGP